MNQYPSQKMDIHVCCQIGNLARLQQLIADGANIDEKDDIGDTPLYYALKNGHAEIAKLLIANGANVNDKNPIGNTPLHHAVEYLPRRYLADRYLPTRYFEILELLIAKGAQCNEKNCHRANALSWALPHGNLEMVRLLIANGANVDDKMNTGWTPLHNVSYWNRLDIVKELIQFLTPANINERDGKGNTPLHLACSQGHLTVVQELIEHCDLSIINNNGETALDIAKTNEIAQFIKDYLEFPGIKEPENP